MKKFLVTIAVLGFAFSAQAEGDHMYEVQINGGFGGGLTSVGGTSGGFNINDEDTGDNSPWSLGAEVYKTMGSNMQVGGILTFGDRDNAGSELGYTLGVVGRYNFDTDYTQSMFAGLGLAYSDLGVDGVDSTRIALLLQFGKRFMLSEHLTWTPNVALNMGIGGDLDEGTSIAINLISFSGFM
jgi:opacity protein-like surface antigen